MNSLENREYRLLENRRRVVFYLLSCLSTSHIGLCSELLSTRLPGNGASELILQSILQVSMHVNCFLQVNMY